MRFGFVTVVQLGLGCLEEIYEAGGQVDHLFTLADDIDPDKSGRVHLDDFGRQHNLPLTKVRSINDDDAVAAIRAADLDWLFVIGWSQIAHPTVLDAPRHGCIGMHPTLLPQGRGRAPIPWAILKGLDRTGVTMFALDEGVDTGPILAQLEIPIESDETATSLYGKVEAAHRQLIREAFPMLVDGSISPVPQDEGEATVWPGRKPEHGLIRPDMSVLEVDRLVRAVTHPYPGAFFVDVEGRECVVWAGSTEPDPGGVSIELRDGTYWATDYTYRSVG